MLAVLWKQVASFIQFNLSKRFLKTHPVDSFEDYKMDKQECQEYINRWKLVAEAEEQEIRNASFKLLLQQTFSIWDIGRSLGFADQDEPHSPLWVELQSKWKEHHA